MQNLRGVWGPFWTPSIYTDTRSQKYKIKHKKIVISDFRQLLLLIIIWILKNFPLEVSKDKPKSISTKKVRTIAAVDDKKRNRYNTTADANDTTADPNDATVRPVTIMQIYISEENKIYSISDYLHALKTMPKKLTYDLSKSSFVVLAA